MKIIAVEYVEQYKIKILFEDNTFQIIDIEPFLTKNPHPQWNKYKKIENFKKFKIDSGNVVWGKDWDLIFPIPQLYSGKIKY